MSRSTLSFGDQIRREIDRSGLSRYRIAHDAGIHQSALSHFMNRHNGLSLESIDRIAEVLDLRVVSGPQPRKARR